jgi:hypothetical protein
MTNLRPIIYPEIDLKYATVVGNEVFPRPDEHACMIFTHVRKQHTDGKHYLIPIVQRVQDLASRMTLIGVIQHCVKDFQVSVHNVQNSYIVQPEVDRLDEL